MTTRKLDITWTTTSGIGPPYFGIARAYTGASGIPYTEVGSINIQKNEYTFVTGPGPVQEYQPDTILESDRTVFEEMAEEYYNGTNTSGVTWRVV